MHVRILLSQLTSIIAVECLLFEHVSCLSAADLAGHGLGTAHTAHQLGGPLGTALSMGPNPPVQRSDDFLRDTFAEVRII